MLQKRKSFKLKSKIKRREVFIFKDRAIHKNNKIVQYFLDVVVTRPLRVKTGLTIH